MSKKKSTMTLLDGRCCSAIAQLPRRHASRRDPYPGGDGGRPRPRRKCRLRLAARRLPVRALARRAMTTPLLPVVADRTGLTWLDPARRPSHWNLARR